MTFKDNNGDDDGCSNEIGSAGLRFPFNKKSECQLEEWNDCKNDRLRGIKWDDRCKDINHGFEDDCDFPEVTNGKECEEYWDNLGKPPICDDDIPEKEGETCRDEGDPDDCEPGLVDRGFGCEAKETCLAVEGAAGCGGEEDDQPIQYEDEQVEETETEELDEEDSNGDIVGNGNGDDGSNGNGNGDDGNSNGSNNGDSSGGDSFFD